MVTVKSSQKSDEPTFLSNRREHREHRASRGSSIVEKVVFQSPAKINLFLKVIGKRPDGYHELFSGMCPIGLYDQIRLEFGGQDRISVSCDHPDVPEDTSNLAYRAADLFFSHSALEGVPAGVHIHLSKKIPVAAGLGGGSSNAASVLMELNRRFENPLSMEQLMEMGLSLGADVPFFIYGIPAYARGIGEVLTPIPSLRIYDIILVCPDIRISTEQIYSGLNLGLTKCEKKPKGLHFEGQYLEAEYHLCNDLESVALTRCPEISEIKRMLIGFGAKGALMSGSGPAVFGLFGDSHVAEAARSAMLKTRRWPVFQVDMLHRPSGGGDKNPGGPTAGRNKF